jgi:predicted DNA-binding transcriptional regulator AlpA
MKSIAEPVSPPAPAPRQRSKRLLPVRAVCSIIDRDEDQVLSLLEEGKLAWSWDVGLSKRTKELRILPAVIGAYLRHEPCSLKWSDVFSLLVPDSPTILAREVSHILNVSSTHVYNLIKQNALASYSAPRTGPFGSARIPTDSFGQFLKNRLFP